MTSCDAVDLHLKSTSAINLVVGPIGWRYVFAAGAAPALITLFVRLFVREPQRWIAARDRRLSAARGGALDSAVTSFLNLFAPDIGRRAMVGLLVAASMMIGAIAGATLLPVWVRSLVGGDPGLAVTVTSQCFMLMNVGAIAGYLALIWSSDAVGRRWSYFLMALGCAASNLSCSRKFDQQLACCGLRRFTASSLSAGSAHLPSIFPSYFRPAFAPPAKAFAGTRRAF